MKNASVHDYIGPRWLFATGRINYTIVLTDHSVKNFLGLQNTFIRITCIFYNAMVKVKKKKLLEVRLKFFFNVETEDRVNSLYR